MSEAEEKPPENPPVMNGNLFNTFCPQHETY